MTYTPIEGTRGVGCDIGSLRLLLVLAHDAMTLLCTGTKWKVTAELFESFNERGSVYVVMKDGAPYVFVQDACVAVDVNDEEISLATATEIAPLFNNLPITSYAFAAAKEPLAEAENRVRRENTFAQVKIRYLNERVIGYVDFDNVKHPPILASEAEAAWRRAEANFRKAVNVIGHKFCFVDEGLINLARALSSLEGERTMRLC